MNPLCSCSLETDSTLHFFLRRHNYTTLRRALMIKSKKTNDGVMFLHENDLLHIIMYGNKSFEITWI